MNFVRRSFISIVRNLGKAIILFLAVLALGIVLSGAISVSQAMQNTEMNLRGDLPPVAIVEADIEALQIYEASTGQLPEYLDALNPQILEEIGALPYVRNFDYSIETLLFSADLERYELDSELLADMGMGSAWTQLNLKGVHGAELFEIEEGIIDLASGRSFTDKEASTLSFVVLISQNFANINNLHIGSTFTLQNIVWDARGFEEVDSDFYIDESIFSQRSYEFEVIGIFVPVVEFNTGDEWLDANFANHIENSIYVSNAVTIAVMRYQFDQMAKMYPDEVIWQENFWRTVWIQNIYTLYCPDDMNAFTHAVEKIAPEFYTVTYASDIFSAMASSIESLESLSLGVLWGAISATVLILSLLITLFVRERKREMGILLALGEKKVKIATQIAAEVLVVALIAMSFSLLVGNFLSIGVSESMLRDSLVAGQIGGQSMTFSTIDFMGFTNNVSTEEVLANYEISLSSAMVLTFFATSIGVVIASTTLPMLYILRLNPRKIMM